MEQNLNKKLEKIIEILWTLKYKNICAYDITDSGVSRFLVVATAISPADNKKYSTELQEKIKYDKKIDGWHKGEWLILDLDDIVIHLFASGFREKYNMDKLYKARQIKIDIKTKKKAETKKSK